MSIVILGGAGVFGSRLAELLIEDGHKVILVGRSEATLIEVANRLDATPLVLDRSDTGLLTQALRGHKASHLIDAAGPFQDYGGYDVARCAIEAGCHYFDLSDDAGFTSGITQLDAEAKAAGVAVISGLSSVPAISGAVVAGLTQGWRDIAHIEAAIMPGNRAPRGRSVMQAILSQVGAPLRLWRAGAWEDVPGWSEPRVYDVPGAGRRRTALIGAPDLQLFPTRFGARSVEFRAGLELGVMQWSLAIWSWLRHRGFAPAPRRFLTPLQWIAARLERFGTDTGGMVVRVIGTDSEGADLDARWTMSVGAGKGPFTPALPAALLARHTELQPGARPALDVFSKAAIETEFKRIGAAIHTELTPLVPLFQKALGQTWDEMPELWRQTHRLRGLKILQGEARVTRGPGFLSRLIGRLFRFPGASEATPVTVRMIAHAGQEQWIRHFGAHRFSSRLREARRGFIFERFGVFEFEMALPVAQGAMEMPVTRGWCLGVPMPKALLPRSETREYIKDGKFRFDVKLSAPVAGLIVHYQGWLEE